VKVKPGIKGGDNAGKNTSNPSIHIVVMTLYLSACVTLALRR
jgi:hypothetical protein